MNLFDSESPHEHIRQHERLSTRLYISLLTISVTILFIYLLFVENIRTATVDFPSPNVVSQLHEKYSMELSCPCLQTSMSYSTFLSLKVRESQHMLL